MQRKLYLALDMLLTQSDNNSVQGGKLDCQNILKIHNFLKTFIKQFSPTDWRAKSMLVLGNC